MQKITRKIIDIPVSEIKKALLVSRSRRSAIDYLGCCTRNSRNFHHLDIIISENNIDVSHCDPNFKFSLIPDILEKSYSFVDVAKYIGAVKDDKKKISSKLVRNIKKYIDENNLDTSHFRHTSKEGFCSSRTHEEIFCENSSVSQSTVKKRFMSMVDYECSNCNISQWMGGIISLQLDHKNGNHCDNRIENLRLLCPNCHSQTETFGRKNRSFVLSKKDIVKDKSDFIKNNELKNQSRKKIVENCDIDFSFHGWAIKMAPLFGIRSAKVVAWMKKHMPVFYEEKCFKNGSSPVVKLTPEQKLKNREDRRKIKSEDFEDIKNMIGKGFKQREVAEKYNVHHSTIQNILLTTP